MSPLPRAARPLAAFCAYLRSFGFAVSSDQTVDFMAATALLGPRSMDDIRRAGLAILAPQPERIEEFEAVFRAFFYGEAAAMPQGEEPGEETVAKDDRGDRFEPPEPSEISESGEAASAEEVLAPRLFEISDDQRLARFLRRAPDALPRRRAFRLKASKTGRFMDLRRTLQMAVRHDGDVVRFARERHKVRHRNVFLLIDVSGSMKGHTAEYLRIAHAVTRAADRVETFTFGTRLTRISRAMRIRDEVRALATAAMAVEDWDGGTRIGEALSAFLAVPRFAGYARGALVIVLSDGLERGDHGEMAEAVRRLSRRAWKLAWLTPLASDPRFRPQTEALKAILPLLDDLGSAGSLEAVADYILGSARDDGPWRADRWLDRQGRAA